MKKLQNKLQEKLQNRKQNNKGFSLVELIIVIAIMAILVGIVGTQVIPYIEKSRKAKDIQLISGMCTDAMTAYSSNAAKLDATETYTIAIDGTSVTAKDSTGAANTDLLNAFKELNNYTKLGTGANELEFESKSGKAITKVTIVCKNGSPMISVTVTGPADANDFKVESN